MFCEPRETIQLLDNLARETIERLEMDIQFSDKY